MPKFNDNYYDRIITATLLLNKHHIRYVEKPRGKIEIGCINYFSTSNKWKDTFTGERGIGIFTLIDYIKVKRKKLVKLKLNSFYGIKNNPNSTF